MLHQDTVRPSSANSTRQASRLACLVRRGYQFGLVLRGPVRLAHVASCGFLMMARRAKDWFGLGRTKGLDFNTSSRERCKRETLGGGGRIYRGSASKTGRMGEDGTGSAVKPARTLFIILLLSGMKIGCDFHQVNTQTRHLQVDINPTVYLCCPQNCPGSVVIHTQLYHVVSKRRGTRLAAGQAPCHECVRTSALFCSLNLGRLL